MSREPVQAAGGVLYRRSADSIEVCLVHRSAYDDWTLPKGKLKSGEQPLAAAVREVFEETGGSGAPELRLPSIGYTLPDGRAKTVDFWLMRCGPGAGGPDGSEVDRLAWLPLPAALDRLTYPDDREVLRAAGALPPVTAVVALVRHGHAGERKNWQGRDELRPIDPEGQQQADRIAAALTGFRPHRLVAATPLRCKQTLDPLADALGGMPIVMDRVFADAAQVAAALSRLIELRTLPRVVVCSQGKVIPPLLAALCRAGDEQAYQTPKGGGWLLTWSGPELLGLSRF